MFPAGRPAGAEVAMPPVAVGPSAGEGCREELWEFQPPLHDCCARREPRVHCFDSMGGPCRTRERHALEPMALQVEGSPIRGRPRCLRAGRWEEEQRRWPDHPRLAAALDDTAGGRRFDAAGFVKQGQDSGGGARQECGPRGKGEHGQGGVVAG
jgi:hypothetical protein